MNFSKTLVKYHVNLEANVSDGKITTIKLNLKIYSVNGAWPHIFIKLESGVGLLSQQKG